MARGAGEFRLHLGAAGPGRGVLPLVRRAGLDAAVRRSQPLLQDLGPGGHPGRLHRAARGERGAGAGGGGAGAGDAGRRCRGAQAHRRGPRDPVARRGGPPGDARREGLAGRAVPRRAGDDRDPAALHLQLQQGAGDGHPGDPGGEGDPGDRRHPGEHRGDVPVLWHQARDHLARSLGGARAPGPPADEELSSRSLRPTVSRRAP